MEFHVLGSGSAGNAALIKGGDFGVLVDFGFGPRTLADRLEQVGAAWDDVHAAFLTHLHNDHWNESTLRHFLRRRVKLYCHPAHAQEMRPTSEVFCQLEEAELVHFYRVGGPAHLDGAMICRPLALRHDSGMTCGFRFEWDGRSLAYATDLGSWNRTLVEALTDVDLLALEFNHDEEMEKTSGRARFLIRRILGERGHLSNKQAAVLLEAVLRASAPGRLQHVVQLHLSRECNRPELAHAAAWNVRQKKGGKFEVHTAGQDEPGPTIRLRKSACQQGATAVAHQQWLPGWHDGEL